MSSSITALLMGASGETGKEVLKNLVASESVEKVILVGRRQLELKDPSPKVVQNIVDFDNLDNFKDSFKDAKIAYCCLGTTRGKAGKDGFVKVDYDYVVNSAKILKENGNCTDFHLLTSQGSNANSWFLYPSTKGKAEDAVKALGFSRLSIYRPGLLMCDREESRAGETFARCAAGLFDRGNKYSVTTADLGKVMVKNSLKEGATTSETLENGDIVKMAKE